MFELLDETRAAVLAKIGKLKEVLDGPGGWFDGTGSLSAENQVKGGIHDLENQDLEIDINLMKLVANSQQERDQKGTLESKQESEGSSLNKNEQMEQSLMENEEELKKEFERDCAKEWNRRRLARASMRLWMVKGSVGMGSIE